jgi:hypothetical protein
MIGLVVLTLVALAALARVTGGADDWFTWRRYARQHPSLSWRDPGRWRNAQVEADQRGGR